MEPVMFRYVAALSLAALVLPAALRAQESDDEWLANCHDSRGDWDYRARPHCEIRELGMKPAGRPLTIDPGLNGGVEVVGWNKDSIGITARIQVNGHTTEDADAIARDIKVEASGGSIRVTGGSTSYDRRRHWGVNLVVMVPRRSDLNISTENGPLSVE